MSLPRRQLSLFVLAPLKDIVLSVGRVNLSASVFSDAMALYNIMYSWRHYVTA